MQSIINSYAAGQGCEQAPETAVGRSLTQLEKDWRRTTLGEDVLLAAFENLLPWLVLIALALLAPLGLSLVNLRVKHA